MPRKSERYASLVLDAQSGQVLHDASAYETRHPASLTKVMTLYMTFEAIEQGRLRMDQRLPVSGWASIQSPTKLDLKEGDTVPVRDLIFGLITKSANDASVVLAEAIAGDEDVFAQRMTQRARQLGMNATTFRNASGLPNDQQVTSAHDMAVMAMAVMRDFPTYYPLFATQEFSYAGRVHTNHNRMLGWYGGAEGLKTGYTNASGFNLIMVAKRDGRRLIGVVMGGDSAQSRDNHMAELMDKGFGMTGGTLVAGNGKVITVGAQPANAGSDPDAAGPCRHRRARPDAAAQLQRTDARQAGHGQQQAAAQSLCRRQQQCQADAARRRADAGRHADRRLFRCRCRAPRRDPGPLQPARSGRPTAPSRRSSAMAARSIAPASWAWAKIRPPSAVAGWRRAIFSIARLFASMPTTSTWPPTRRRDRRSSTAAAGRQNRRDVSGSTPRTSSLGPTAQAAFAHRHEHQRLAAALARRRSRQHHQIVIRRLRNRSAAWPLRA